MVELITRDIPFICTVSANDLSYADRFMLDAFCTLWRSQMRFRAVALRSITAARF